MSQLNANGVLSWGAYDQQKLDDAVRRGWVSEREAAEAKAGLAELVELIKAGRLRENAGALAL